MPLPATSKIYLGVDPGAGGGLAAISGGKQLSIAMPTTERDAWNWFQSYQRQNAFALIEQVHAMPGNGVTGMFRFGMSYGGLRMALVAAGIPFEDVQPRTWQKAMGITPRKKRSKVTAKDREALTAKIGVVISESIRSVADEETQTAFKNRLKAKAQQLFPNMKVTLATADALLIAEYARRKQEGRL